MLNYDNFAVTLGRAVDVFRTSPDSVVQQKGALRALVALSSLGAVALRAEEGVLLAGGKPIPVTLPFVSGLGERMEARGIRRLNIARGASAFDLLAIVKSLAADESEVPEGSLERFGSVGVDRIEIAPEELGRDRRPASVTMAFDRDEVLKEAGEIDVPDEAESEAVIPADETEDADRTDETDEAESEAAIPADEAEDLDLTGETVEAESAAVIPADETEDLDRTDETDEAESEAVILADETDVLDRSDETDEAESEAVVPADETEDVDRTDETDEAESEAVILADETEVLTGETDEAESEAVIPADETEVLTGETDEAESEAVIPADEAEDVHLTGETVEAAGLEEGEAEVVEEATDDASEGVAEEPEDRREEPVSAGEAAESEPGRDPDGSAQPTRDLEIAMLKLAGASGGDDVESLVGSVVEGVEGQLDSGSDAAALEGIACLVNLEPQVPTSLTRSYTDGIQRLLVPETLVRLARLVADNRHARYAVAVLHRAGPAGTNALMEQLVKAPSVEEKDAYGAALVAVPDGVEGLRHALESKYPTVAMIAIDQLTKLNVTDTAPALGSKARSHPKPEVRLAACEALCKMQFTDEISSEIENLLGSNSARLVARCVDRDTPEALVELVITASENDTDQVTKKALCWALGRVGSPRATQQLIKMSFAGGRFFGRKPVEERLAAIEGLGLIPGPAALGTMEELARDRNSSIRAAARATIDKREGRV